MLGDRSGQIIEPDLATYTAEEVESVDMTSGESLERLAVRVHLPPVGFDQTEAVKLARGDGSGAPYR